MDEQKTNLSRERIGFTVPEVAKMLPASERFIWGEISKGSLGSVRLRRKVLVSREQLERYIRRNSINERKGA